MSMIGWVLHTPVRRCSRRGAAGRARGMCPRRITVALGSEPTTLDPQLADDGSERAINDNIYETLLARTPKGDLIPALAESTPAQSAPDAWRFKLRPGIKFSQWRAAQCRCRGLQRQTDHRSESSALKQISYFSAITEAKKIDDLTVDVITQGPDPILPARMYWMKMVPPAPRRNPISLKPGRDRTVQAAQLDPRIVYPIGEERCVLGQRTEHRHRQLSLYRRVRHPPRRT